MTTTDLGPDPDEPESMRQVRLQKLRQLQELRARRDELMARDPGGNRKVLLEQHATPLDFAERFDLRTRRTPALELIARRMRETVTTHDGRLVISMSPQEGKTEMVRWLISWMLANDPDKRIVYASFAMSPARATGREVRNKLRTHPELCLPLDKSHQDATDWAIAGHRGGLYSVGVGGALTGRPADCVSGDTVLTTLEGLRSARDIYGSASECFVLSYNHHFGRREYRRVEATRRIDRRPTVDVELASGRTLRCTADHLVHTPHGYRAAGVLRPGDEVTVADLCGVREAHGQQEGSDVPLLLSGRESQHVPAGAVHTLRHRAPSDARGVREEAAEGPNQPLLLTSVLGGSLLRSRQGPSLRAMWPEDRAGQRPEVLHGRVSASRHSEDSNVAAEDLPAVRRGVQAEEQSHGALLEGLREPHACRADGGSGQLALCRRQQLRGLVPADAPADHRAGRAGVPSMLDAPGAVEVHARRQGDNQVEDASASHRPRSTEQRAGEPDLAVRDVPRDASQVATDTVSVVRAVCGADEPVYDLQVEGNRNFFAGEVLVHNCMIIDDPLRGQAEADSPLVRERLMEWWASTSRTRLGPGAPVLVIQTRWHESDMAGHFIEAGWPYINIPALADGVTEDALEREPGEWLISARGRTAKDWEATRDEVGERTFAALYQGRPAPLEGGIFKYDWFNAHRIPEDKRPALSNIVVGVDPADTGKGDAAGILVAGTTGSGKIVFIADLSAQLSQAQWARKACIAWITYGANRIVQEHNLGMRTSIPDAWNRLRRQAQALADVPDELLINGDDSRPMYAMQYLADLGDAHRSDSELSELRNMLPVFRQVLDAGESGPRVVSITPKQSKRIRAESVAGAFETGRAVMLGEDLKKLEYEAATWLEGQKSPNRIDVMAMLTTHLEAQRGAVKVSRAGTSPSSTQDGASVTSLVAARLQRRGGLDVATQRGASMAPLPPNDPRGEIS